MWILLILHIGLNDFLFTCFADKSIQNSDSLFVPFITHDAADLIIFIQDRPTLFNFLIHCSPVAPHLYRSHAFTWTPISSPSLNDQVRPGAGVLIAPMPQVRPLQIDRRAGGQSRGEVSHGSGAGPVITWQVYHEANRGKTRLPKSIHDRRKASARLWLNRWHNGFYRDISPFWPLSKG